MNFVENDYPVVDFDLMRDMGVSKHDVLQKMLEDMPAEDMSQIWLDEVYPQLSKGDLNSVNKSLKSEDISLEEYADALDSFDVADYLETYAVGGFLDYDILDAFGEYYADEIEDFLNEGNPEDEWNSDYYKSKF